MFKKLGIVTTMSTALLLGGAFTNTVDAETTDYNQKQTQQNLINKVSNSINAKYFSNLDDNLDGLLQNFFANYQVNWNNNFASNNDSEKVDKNVEKKETTEQPTQKQEAPKQSEPKKEAPEKVEAPEQQSKPKQEAPKQETSKQESESKQEAPKQETSKQESEAKQEAPAKAEAPAQQQPAQKQDQQTQAQSDQLNAYEKQVVELTNNERVERGLEPLKVDLELSKVAREKSRDMSVNDYFSHTSPTYGSPFDMMKSYGIDYRSAGENIARGQRTPEEVVNGWMNSEGHRANILSAKFTHIGVGYIADGNYWTQEFIGK